MLFDKVFEVEAELHNSLETYSDGNLNPQLELRLDNLRKIEKEIQDQYDKFLPKNKAYITIERNRFGDTFELFPPHARTIHSSETSSLPNKIIAVKGSGFWQWLSENPRFINEKGIERRHPILISKYPHLETHRVWGGETTYFANVQYINALILNALIRRHNISQATYEPIRCVKFRNLPIEEGGEIKSVNLSEYCNQHFKSEEKNDIYAIPSLDIANTFVEFFYAGKQINKRVLPSTFKDGCGCRYYSAGLLKNEFHPKEKKKRIEDFTKNIATLLKVVHDYQGTFTSRGGFSSLTASNVSLGGIICDLDTVSFDPENYTEEMVKWDLLNALQTIKAYAELFEDITLKDPNVRKSYKIGYNGYAYNGFAKDAFLLFEEIYPLQKKFCNDTNHYIWR